MDNNITNCKAEELGMIFFSFAPTPELSYMDILTEVEDWAGLYALRSSAFSDSPPVLVYQVWLAEGIFVNFS